MSTGGLGCSKVNRRSSVRLVYETGCSKCVVSCNPRGTPTSDGLMNGSETIELIEVLTEKL